MVLTWVICQGCFVFAALAREKPHRLENAPAPWSRAMLAAAWNDKAWLRLLVVSSLFAALFGFATTYVPYYAWKTLGMPRESSAWFQITALVMRTISFGFGGYLVDRIGAKRVLVVTPLATLLTLLPPLLLRNELSIYLSTGIGALTSGVTAIAATVAMFSLPKAENRAGHYTLQLMVQNIANGIGPLLTGALCDRFNYLPTFTLAAIGSLLFIPVYGWAVRPMREAHSGSA
jgi:MFS family permease